jgi:hypothetical protein
LTLSLSRKLVGWKLLQVLLGLAFGFIGLLLASPLRAAAMILVQMLYVEDVIGDQGSEANKVKIRK